LESAINKCTNAVVRLTMMSIGEQGEVGGDERLCGEMEFGTSVCWWKFG